MNDAGLVAFAERCLALLDRGAFSATYKYAVLLGIIDLCLERTSQDGLPPRDISTRQLSEKVIELYWPHTVPFKRADHLLRQNNNGQAEIISLIRSFREGLPADPLAPLGRARLLDTPRFERLVGAVEWKLIEMPLPKLQRVGNVDDPFLYHIRWDDKVRPSDPIDRKIYFQAGTPERLVQLAGLLRPLIQREWASMVARFNPEEVDAARLEEFLFGRGRVSLEPVRDDLRDLQKNRCFYCDGALGRQTVVDHFLPWSRHANDAIENLVAADARCNSAKRDFLAASEHLGRWRDRLLRPELATIAQRRRWESALDRTEGVARALYLRLPEGAKLWRRRNEFVAAEGPLLRRVFGG